MAGSRAAATRSNQTRTVAKSRSASGSASISRAACFIRSYSISRRTSSARGSSGSAPGGAGGRGNSSLDFISISTAAINKYSAASSSCFLRELAGALATVGDDVAHERRIVEILLRAFVDRLLLADDRVDHRLLALETADACGRASLDDPILRLLAGVNLVQRPDRTFFRV